MIRSAFKPSPVTRFCGSSSRRQMLRVSFTAFFFYSPFHVFCSLARRAKTKAYQACFSLSFFFFTKIQRPSDKYQPAPTVHLPDRTWPSKIIDKAPRWCAVDLRDGNQSLVNPMTVAQKTKFFDLLIKCGFKEIEVGFPAASDTDFDFVRKMAKGPESAPDDVAIQVQCFALRFGFILTIAGRCSDNGILDCEGTVSGQGGSDSEDI